MKKILLAFACSIIACISFAQLTTSVYGGNKRAWTGERIGFTVVIIRMP